MPKSKICHCGKDGHALNSINCPVHGNKPQKYQCWKCEGKGILNKETFYRVDDTGIIIDTWTEGFIYPQACPNCNGKGYIPLIPYEEETK